MVGELGEVKHEARGNCDWDALFQRRIDFNNKKEKDYFLNVDYKCAYNNLFNRCQEPSKYLFTN